MTKASSVARCGGRGYTSAPWSRADRGNLRVVRRNNDAVDLAHLLGDINRPGEQRLSSQRPNVFPRNRFAAAPRGNDCDNSFSIQHAMRPPEFVIQQSARAQSSETVERLAVFGPFPGIDPGILADRKNANAPAGLLIFSMKSVMSHRLLRESDRAGRDARHTFRCLQESCIAAFP